MTTPLACDRPLLPSAASNASRWLVYSTLLMCPIEKNDATEWLRLFYTLHNKNADAPWAHEAYSERTQRLPLWTAYNATIRAQLMACPRMERLVVVRDPLERLLSAFLDKCQQWTPSSASGRHCVTYHRNVPPPNVTFADFVGRLARADVAGPRCDRHFCLQSSFCNISSLVKVKGGVRLLSMSSPSYTTDVAERLRRHAIDPAKLQTNSDHSTGAATRLREYYTPELAKRAYGLYKDDYAILRLPKPNALMTPVATS